MIGCGSMGGSMALLFAEHGVSVSLNDPSAQSMDKIICSAKDQNIHPLPTMHEDYKSLCASIGSPKVFFFSLPHGKVGDQAVDGLHPHLDKGDIIVDCANEHWHNLQ
jgi:6-phosphogluconate dehydrogenase